MSKKPKKRFNVVSPFKSDLNKIDRIFAKDGQVWIFTTDNRHKMLTVREAAFRAKSLNDMLPKLPVDMRKAHSELVEKIIKVIREAKYQIENKESDPKTKLLTNLVEGKTAKGAPAHESFKEEDNIKYYMLKYSQLSEEDIAAVLRNDDLDIPRKELIMGEMQKLKLSEISGSPILMP